MRRGQATVETALGMLVFVTVLMFGVHFGEISVLEMKVTEAANAAMWDTSAEKVHDYAPPWSSGPVNGAAANAASKASQRYKNFDGRTAANWPSVAPNGGTFTGAFTQASNLTVRCNVGGGPNYTRFPYPPLWLIFPDNGGMTCHAQARTSMIRVPTSLVDGTWSLHQHQDSPAFSGMTVCSMGRGMLAGNCNREFGTLIDDWGYMTGNGSGETGNCSLLPYNVPCVGGGDNLAYWTAVFTVWLVNTFVPPGSQSGADKRLIQGIYTGTPWWPWVEPLLGPTGFGMSSCQEGGGTTCQTWAQTLIWASDGFVWSWVWNTTPLTVPFFTYAVAYAQRKGCYLGRDCSVQENNWNP